MEQLVLHVLNVVAPVLLCVLAGFGLAWFRLPFDNKMVTMLVSNVGYPTLIISHLAAGHVALGEFLVMMAGALWRGCGLALFHLVMAGGVAFALAHLFGFTGVARGVFILMCMMPPSVATYLWVDMYDPDHAPDVAGFILISTLLTVVVLPLVLTFWI